MAATKDQQPIIVKRIKKGAHGHHGGAWKIAYADFVTAMMAFFLLMWLLGSVSKADLDGISEYFKQPMKLAMSGGEAVANRSSLIVGGGRDMTSNDKMDVKKDISEEEAKKIVKEAERMRLKALKQKLEEKIEESPILSEFKNQILIDITAEGLRVQIVDDKNRPMFALGSADLQPYTKLIVQELTPIFEEVPNRLSLAGHTDALSFAGAQKGYSNWELSVDRANITRQIMIRAQMSQEKMLRVVGLGSAAPFEPADLTAAANRRISIIVLNKEAEEAILKSGLRPDLALTDR